ncbi:MAG: hypothetical protein U9P79_07455 [Candidatus Cloacimonadota bacterium]|nr:hypothetical protein [Candidatus Cloacimonadota bacterium]
MKIIGILVLLMLLCAVSSAGNGLFLKFNNLNITSTQRQFNSSGSNDIVNVIIANNIHNLNEVPNVPNFHSESSTDLLESIERPKGCFLFALDTVILPGIQLGWGQIKYDSTYVRENMVTLHLNTIGFVTTMGSSWNVNRFRSLDRAGLYNCFNLGLDYVIMIGPEPGGGGDIKHYVFPNISYGLGYSFKIGTNSFFRISLDFGLKLIISNLKISFIF